MRYFVTVILFFLNAHCLAQLPVHDTFDGEQLSLLWDTSRFEKGAVIMQSNVVHTGIRAAKITLHQGDKYEAGNDSSLASERAELLEAKKLVSREHKTYEYAFSMFIPADFPIVPTRLVIAQWKQHCTTQQCEDDSPVLALRYTNGKLQITIQTGAHREVYYQTNSDIRNKWITFKFTVNFSRDNDGFIKGWINDTQVLDYKGKSAYGAERGYALNSYFYFKMGLYRDRMVEPMTIYIDDYSKTQLPN